MGSDEYNIRLSQRRAQAVVDWLVARGIARERLNAVGKGEREPIASNETAEGRQLNRRVEVRRR
jgi:outer membrane protein OmpA-like peptidoglycan-associated protein